MRFAGAALLAAAMVVAPGRIASVSHAEEGWKPFVERDTGRRGKTAAETPPAPPLPPMDGRIPAGNEAMQPGPAGAGSAYTPGGSAGGSVASQPLPPLDSKVERGDLAPVMASDGSGLPMDLWQGLDLARVEQLIARLEIPPRSPALHGLWRRLITADAGMAGASPDQLAALKAEALYRSGMMKEMATVLAGAGDSPVVAALRARAGIAMGDVEAGCGAAKSAATQRAALPPRLKAETIVIVGYCAAATGNAGGAGLAAELSRDEGIDAPFALAALDAIAAGQKPRLALPKRLSAVEYRLISLLGIAEPAAILERADAPVLATLVADASADPKLRLAAAEAAARSNVIGPDGLAEIYRAQSFAAADLADPLNSRADPLLRRALLFKSAEHERTPMRKVRTIRALLDDARRSGIYLPALKMVAPIAADVPQVHEVGWFAETAVEIALAAGRFDQARAWVAFARTLDRPGGSPDHWLALVDIADPQQKSARGQMLPSVEELALHGRFAPEMLHRLATALDALDYNVPIPLWDAANRAPQPAAKHLPEQGILPELMEASKRKEFGRTVLLTLHTLGPEGAEGAHIIALGDSIRALRRSGLDADARRIAFEALFAGWPRTPAN